MLLHFNYRTYINKMDRMDEATVVAKDKISFFFVFKHNIFSLHSDDLCTAHLLLL